MCSVVRPRILLIDDDPNVREVLGHLLASFGCDVHTAPEGTSGLARFAEGNWDLVLVDVVMPAVSGWVVVETIRRKPSPPPIVLLTGMNEPAVMQRARKWRLPVLIKPFREDALRAIVATALHPPSSSLPPDPICARCSKPVRSGGFIETTVGEVVHIGCHSQQLQLDLLDQGGPGPPRP
jgi:CheY-like chemotaxis protein